MDSLAGEKIPAVDPVNRRTRRWGKWLGGALLVMVVVYLFEAYELRVQFSRWFRQDVQVWLRAHPVAAPFVYILLYVGAVVALMPGSVITLVGGALFGPLLGTVYVSIASTAAAAVSFLIARHLAADWVERKASGQLARIKGGIEAEGWRFVAFTRLVPLFPYTLLNYMFGLTRIRLWTYVWVSWVCMLPGTFAYVYSGYAAKQAAAGTTDLRRTLVTVSIALGLLVLVSMLPRWIKARWGNPVPGSEETESGDCSGDS